jgi:formylglycine-generating enzyme required for sulfatase activity
MIEIPRGTYITGSDRHYAEERPVAARDVPGFLIDAYQVTNRDFAKFVAATAYQTTAEKIGGSSAFKMTAGPVDLNNPDLWWQFVAGANWRHPEGPDSSLDGLDDHPVVHVSKDDAQAYAQWRSARLPDEWEWEVAARGGLAQADYVWGDDFSPDGQLQANIWTGLFPWYFARGPKPGTMPVGQYQANGYSLYDMAGNVWEWTTSRFDHSACCGPQANATDTLITLRGGSFLCAAEYCLRYRPAARIGILPNATTNHIGFRCVQSLSE